MTIEQLVRFESLKDEFARLSESVRSVEAESAANIRRLPAELLGRLLTVSEQLRIVEGEVVSLDVEVSPASTFEFFPDTLRAELDRRVQARQAKKRPKVKVKRKTAEKVY